MSVQATNAVWQHSRQRGSRFLVMLALADQTRDGVAWPSANTIAQMTRLSLRQAKRALSAAVASGEVEITRSGGGRTHSNLYRITLIGDSRDTDTPLNDDTHDTDSPHEMGVAHGTVSTETVSSEAETVTFPPGNGVTDDTRTVRQSKTLEPKTKIKNTPSPNLSPEIAAVYDYWRTRCGKTHHAYQRCSPARRAKIASRLAEFTVDELKAAIDGVVSDPWEQRRLHDDITVIFRSREKVERFLEMPGRLAENGEVLSESPAEFAARIAAIDEANRERWTAT